MELNLFDVLIIWLGRNRKTFTVGHDTYNHRVYIHGNYTFMEYSDTEVGVLGLDFYFKATCITELMIMIKAIIK